MEYIRSADTLSASLAQPDIMQLALAESLTGSKPPSISITDHIFLLRKCYLTPTQIAEATKEAQTGLPCIDIANYWHFLFQKSISREEDLQSQIFELERQLLKQRVGHDATQASAPESDAAGKKRKANDIAGKAAKKSKTVKAADNLSADERFASELQGGTSNITCNTLLRHIFKLQTLLGQDTLQLNDNELATALKLVSNAFDASLSSYCETSRASTTAETDLLAQEKLEAYFRALGRVVLILAQGFKTLVAITQHTLPKHPTSTGATIYHLISIFRHILSQITITTEHSKPEKAPPPPPPSTGPTTKSKKKAPPPPPRTKPIPPKPNPLLVPLMRLAHSFLTTFHNPRSTIHPAYTDVQEGTLHVLLTRAGALLYILTFKHPRAPTLADEFDVLTSNLPPTTTGAHDLRPPKETPSEDAKRANLEARHLLPLLRYLLVENPSPAYHPRRAFNPSSSSSSYSSSSSSSDIDIVTPSLLRLQNTLIRGIFGSDDGGPFAQTLKLPEAVELPLPEGVGGKVVDEWGAGAGGGGKRDGEAKRDGEGTWFMRQMWEVVGWDVLAMELERLSLEE